MADAAPPGRPRPEGRQRHDGAVWPGEAYQRQLAALRRHVGREVYLAEVAEGDLHLSVTFPHRPCRLLAVIDYPAPDPAAQLYPHMLVLDDGRGVNLGRVARVSLGRAYQPEPEQVLFENRPLLRALLFAERRLDRAQIQRLSRAQLGALLGRPPRRRLAGEGED